MNRKGALFVVMAMVAVMTFFSTTGCSDKKPSTQDTAVSTTDSVSAVTDTMETIIAEAPMPRAADELFDDFIFNFAANKKLQFKRIHFPLPIVRGGNTTYVPANKWKMEHFFMQQDYYTLIFDNAKQMNVVKDTTISHVVVEKIFLSRNSVKQYNFDREQGKWMLTSICHKNIGENYNSSFLKFYKVFVADSTFQAESIDDPLHFTGPDPDDEFTNMSGILAPEQWPMFAPELPNGMIYNILYGQKYTESNKKIFVIRGIANGQETELTFVRKGKHWKLTRLIM